MKPLNWLKKYLPTQKTLEKNHELKGLKPYLKAPTLWTFDCESVARGMAAGLAGSVIPGFQILYAAVLVLLLRGNLPIALFATLVTNPFTAIPIIYFIHFIGALIIGNGHANFVVQEFHWDFSSFHSFWSNFSNWILQFGKAYFVGVPIVSVSLGVIGYLGTILIWKAFIFLFKKNKK